MDNVSMYARRRGKPPGQHLDKAHSPAFARTAPPGRHCDGQGLYLLVQPSGIRSWIQRLVVRRRRRELGLGSIPLVPLAEAREKAIANRKIAREGGDPVADKRCGRAMPTFTEAAERVLEQKRPGWQAKAAVVALAAVVGPDIWLPAAVARSSQWLARSPSCRCYHLSARIVAGRQRPCLVPTTVPF